MITPQINEKEVNFLILRYLELTLGKNITSIVEKELAKSNKLPVRYDWTGKQNPLNYDELMQKHPHISPEHLKSLLERLLGVSNEKYPFPSRAWTLIGHDGFRLTRYEGHQLSSMSTLLQTAHKGRTQSAIQNYNNNNNIRQNVSLETYVNLIQKISPSRHLAAKRSNVKINNYHVIQAIQTGIKPPRKYRPPVNLYGSFRHLITIQGHKLPLYCIIFDRSGNRIITGSDDRLVKVWSTRTGLLLHTLRGHESDITDLAIDESNEILASSSNDNVIRLWDMKTFHPISNGVLLGHNKPVTTVQFSPNPYERILLTTSLGGVARLWYMDEVERGPIVLEAGGQMLCAAFSPGGSRFVTGGGDGCARVWCVNPPRLLQVLRGHRPISLNTVSWCRHGSKILTGSHDGTARIWDWSEGELKWVCITVLTWDRRIPNTSTTTLLPIQENEVVVRCTMVCWSLYDKYAITAFSNSSVKVWDATTGNLVHDLMKHTKEVYILDVHPTDERILLSAGYDGKIIIWDLDTGTPIRIFSDGDHKLADGHFSPSGDFIVVSDKDGFFSLYGIEDGEVIRKAPTAQFFATDYLPLRHDSFGYVLDETYQTPPHLIDRFYMPLCNQFLEPYTNQPTDISLIDNAGLDPYEYAKIHNRRIALFNMEMSLFGSYVRPVIDDLVSSLATDRHSRRGRPATIRGRSGRSGNRGGRNGGRSARQSSRGGRRRGYSPDNVIEISEILNEDIPETYNPDDLNEYAPSGEASDDSYAEIGPSSVTTRRRARNRRNTRSGNQFNSRLRIRSTTGRPGRRAYDSEDDDDNILDEDFIFSNDDDDELSPTELEDDLIRITEDPSSDRNNSTITDDILFSSGVMTRSERRKYEKERKLQRRQLTRHENLQVGNMNTENGQTGTVENSQVGIIQQQQMVDNRSETQLSRQMRHKLRMHLKCHKTPLHSYPQWLTSVYPSTFSSGAYTPQLGDRVVFFKDSGHKIYMKEFIEFADPSKNPNPVPDWLPSVVYCRVIGIKYHLKPFIHCTINLITEQPQPDIEKLKCTLNDTTTGSDDRHSTTKRSGINMDSTTNGRYINQGSNFPSFGNQGQIQPYYTPKPAPQPSPPQVPSLHPSSTGHMLPLRPYSFGIQSFVPPSIPLRNINLNQQNIPAISQKTLELPQPSLIPNPIVNNSVNKETEKTSCPVCNCFLSGTSEQNTHHVNMCLESDKHRSVGPTTNPSMSLITTQTNTQTTIDQNRQIQIEKQARLANEPVRFTIHYHATEHPDSLVLASRFEAAMKIDWKVSTRFRMFYPSKQNKGMNGVRGAWYRGSIVKVLPPDAMDSPWECLTVKWDSETYEEQVSPWEIQKLEPFDINDERPVDILVETINPEISQRIISVIQREILSTVEARPFLQPINLKIETTYNESVPYPIDISTIIKRLQNSFYRTIEHLKFDIRQMSENARLYHVVSSPIVRDGEITTRRLLSVIDRFCTFEDRDHHPLVVKVNPIYRESELLQEYYSDEDIDMDKIQTFNLEADDFDYAESDLEFEDSDSYGSPPSSPDSFRPGISKKRNSKKRKKGYEDGEEEWEGEEYEDDEDIPTTTAPTPMVTRSKSTHKRPLPDEFDQIVADAVDEAERSLGIPRRLKRPRYDDETSTATMDEQDFKENIPTTGTSTYSLRPRRSAVKNTSHVWGPGYSLRDNNNNNTTPPTTSQSSHNPPLQNHYNLRRSYTTSCITSHSSGPVPLNSTIDSNISSDDNNKYQQQQQYIKQSDSNHDNVRNGGYQQQQPVNHQQDQHADKQTTLYNQPHQSGRLRLKFRIANISKEKLEIASLPSVNTKSINNSQLSRSYYLPALDTPVQSTPTRTGNVVSSWSSNNPVQQQKQKKQYTVNYQLDQHADKHQTLSHIPTSQKKQYEPRYQVSRTAVVEPQTFHANEPLLQTKQNVPQESVGQNMSNITNNLSQTNPSSVVQPSSSSCTNQHSRPQQPIVSSHIIGQTALNTVSEKRTRIKTRSQTRLQASMLEEEDNFVDDVSLHHKKSGRNVRRKPKQDEEFVYHEEEDDDDLLRPKKRGRGGLRRTGRKRTKKDEDGEFLLDEEGGEDEDDYDDVDEGYVSDEDEPGTIQSQQNKYNTRSRSSTRKKDFDDDFEDVVNEKDNYDNVQRRPRTRSQKGRFM